MASVPSGTKLGRYEVVKPLAGGGMTELLLVRSAPADRPLVLKWVRPEHAIDGAFVEAFAGEGHRAATLHHPNIVEVHEVGREDGTHYLAMEYVHGDDLRKLLARLHERRAKLPVQHILAICTALTQALHHAHEKVDGDAPILHLGIKPSNVIITAEGAVKLGDFGIGRAALGEGRTDMLPAIAAYLAPEQCTGQPVDRRTDIFQIGVLMYELAVGRRLFKCENEFVTMAAIVAGDVPSPTKHRGDLPKELETVIMKALARAPEDRFQTASELQTALEKFATKAGVRGSLTTLAGYTKRLFGMRPEPWLTEDASEVVAAVDFDGAPKGLAMPPPDPQALDLPAVADAPILRMKTLASRELPTEQLSLATGKVIDKSTPLKIPAGTANGSNGGNGVRPLAKPPQRPTPVPITATPRSKTKTVQIPQLQTPNASDKADLLSVHDVPTVVEHAPANGTPKATPTARPNGTSNGTSNAGPNAAKAPPPQPAPSETKPTPNGTKPPAPKPLKPIVSAVTPAAAGEIKSAKSDDDFRPDTEVDTVVESTAVATPPPMPVVATTPGRDATEHVKPLPIRATTAMSIPENKNKKWLLIGGLVAVAAAAALVIGLGLFGDKNADPQPSESEVLAKVEEPKPPKLTPPPPSDESLRTADTPRTPRNSHVTSDDVPTPTEQASGPSNGDPAGDPAAEAKAAEAKAAEAKAAEAKAAEAKAAEAKAAKDAEAKAKAEAKAAEAAEAKAAKDAEAKAKAEAKAAEAAEAKAAKDAEAKAKAEAKAAEAAEAKAKAAEAKAAKAAEAKAKAEARLESKPAKFEEPKDPSPPDEPKAKPSTKPKAKPTAVVQKPKPKSTTTAAAKPKPTTTTAKPATTTTTKPAAKWDPNALFPKK